MRLCFLQLCLDTLEKTSKYSLCSLKYWAGFFSVWWLSLKYRTVVEKSLELWTKKLYPLTSKLIKEHNNSYLERQVILILTKMGMKGSSFNNFQKENSKYIINIVLFLPSGWPPLSSIPNNPLNNLELFLNRGLWLATSLKFTLHPRSQVYLALRAKGEGQQRENRGAQEIKKGQRSFPFIQQWAGRATGSSQGHYLACQILLRSHPLGWKDFTRSHGVKDKLGVAVVPLLDHWYQRAIEECLADACKPFIVS